MIKKTVYVPPSPKLDGDGIWRVHCNGYDLLRFSGTTIELQRQKPEQSDANFRTFERWLRANECEIETLDMNGSMSKHRINFPDGDVALLFKLTWHV